MVVFSISVYKVFQREMRTEQEASVFIPGHLDGPGTLDSSVVAALWTQENSFIYPLLPCYSENNKRSSLEN